MSDQLTQARDRIAELCGWQSRETHVYQNHPGQECWVNTDGTVRIGSHPIPACLNFVSKVWPDGKRWHEPMALSANTHEARVAWHLDSLLMTLEDLQANDPPAFDAAVEKIRKEIRG